MTARRQGFLLRAGVVSTLLTGVALLPALPAHADVKLDVSTSNVVLAAGESKPLSVTITGKDDDPPATVNVEAAQLNNDVTIQAPQGCSGSGSASVTCANLDVADATRKLTFTLVAKNPTSLQPGENRQGTVSVKVDDAANQTKNVGVQLRGPTQAPSVTEVSGTVADQSTGDNIGGVLVVLKDSANHTYDTRTDNKGGYKFTGDANKPIAPGKLTIGASHNGFEQADVTRDGVAGRALTGVKLSMKPSPGASTPPSVPVTDPAPAVPSASAVTADPTTVNASADSGTSWLSILLIGMGVLLVLLGVGAIVLLLMRRRDDRDDPEDLDGPNGGPPAGAGAVPAGRGGYRGADATMMAHSNMNDETAIVPAGRQQLDEFPDPYAAAPTAAGYGYGRGDEPAYGGGYGEAPRAGRYDEPTGRYEEPTGRYEEPTGRYAGPGGGGGGYPAAGGYPDERGGDPGYGRRGGGDPAATAYEPRGAYAPSDDYERPRAGGYDRAGQYDEPPYPPGAYEAPRGYEGQGRGPAAPPPNGRGRSVDWMGD